MNTFVVANQELKEPEGTASGCEPKCCRNGRGLSRTGKMLICLLLALGVMVVGLLGCTNKQSASTNEASPPANSVAGSSAVPTNGAPATTTAEGSPSVSSPLNSGANSAAATAKSQKQPSATPAAASTARKPAAGNHGQTALRRKAPAAGKHTAATAGKHRQASAPTAVPPASKPAAATADKQEQGVWASPLRSLGQSSCGPSGCGPSGCK